MMKLEALDLNTVHEIRIVDDTVYAEASIDWPEIYLTASRGHGAVKIGVVAKVPLADHDDPADAVHVACQKAVGMLNAAFQARFPDAAEPGDPLTSAEIDANGARIAEALPGGAA